MKTTLGTLLITLLLAVHLPGCGAGVPVQLRIDEFYIDVNTEDWMSLAESTLTSRGFLPQEAIGVPEKWPTSLPAIKYDLSVVSPAIPIDLTPEPTGEEGEDTSKYDQINQAQKVVQRIEINDLILRIERSNLSIDLPSLELQVSDTVDAHPNDRRSWVTVGILDGLKAGKVGDMRFEFVKGGETYLNNQFYEEEREFALRIKGNLTIDTAANPNRPRGQARIRLIALTTFYLTPRKAL